MQGLLNALPRTLVRGENGLYLVHLYRALADARRFRTTLVRPVGNDVFIEMERDVYGTR